MATEIEEVAYQFGLREPIRVSLLSSGLIHQTYRVEDANQRTIVLQAINQNVFKEPLKIIQNYQVVYKHLAATNALQIPAAQNTLKGESQWIDASGNFWRATTFISNAYTEELPITVDKAYQAAKSFASLTRALITLAPQQLQIVIPDFHNLKYRFHQLEKAVTEATPIRLKKSSPLLNGLLTRKNYVDFYEYAINDPSFPQRIMHHDCKLSNILFNKYTQEAICPIDLDTLMPGYFFSDIGDMIRSMTPTVNEGVVATEQNMQVRKDIYEALLAGYTEGMGDELTNNEKANLPLAGHIMTYMQALRFLTDYLNNDCYYQTSYAEQNYDRALNQLFLLQKLEVLHSV